MHFLDGLDGILCCEVTLGVDGLAGREAVKMAERLADEQAHVSIFALGVGRGVEKTEMQKIIGVCGADKVAARYIPLYTLDEAPW